MVPTSLTSIRTARKCVSLSLSLSRSALHARFPPCGPAPRGSSYSSSPPPPSTVSPCCCTSISCSTTAFVSPNLAREVFGRFDHRSLACCLLRIGSLEHDSLSFSLFLSCVVFISLVGNRAVLRALHVFVAQCFRRRVYACVIRSLPLSPINCVLTDETNLLRDRSCRNNAGEGKNIMLLARTYTRATLREPISPGLSTRVSPYPRTHLAPVPHVLRNIAYRAAVLSFLFYDIRARRQ